MDATLLEATAAAIVPVDSESARAVRRRLDGKTKPRGSLGLLEELAARLAAIYGRADPPLPAKAIVVLAADHGVARQGVSAYPSAVTAQMVKNFAAGGAAINVLARQAGARVVVADLGTLKPDDIPGVLSCRVGAGTADFTVGPAMSRASALRAIAFGIELAGRLADEGIGLVGLGDMGIGNTSAASALTAALTGAPIHRVTGRGTGIDDERQRRKIDAIETALNVNRPDRHDPLDVLARVGGFEIAGLAGLVLGCAARRLAVLMDGFITSAAALIAVRLCPTARDYLIAAHRSVEPGHAVLLAELEQRPLLDLELRLGEGTGAALAMHLVDAALRILHEMASFADAGVTDTGA